MHSKPLLVVIGEQISENLWVEEAVEQRNKESLEWHKELSDVGPDGETEPRACRWIDDWQEVISAKQRQQ